MCGNGTVDGDEACEPSDTAECTTFTGAGFESGTATCLADCTAWDKTTCVCPDDKVIDGEGNCVENNECVLETDNCDENATCTDTPDSFTCACNDYYTGDGTACTFCKEDTQCAANCTLCADANLPKCKDNGDNTSQCVECLDDTDCTSPEKCDTSVNECKTEYCGDGIKNGTEECDDGNDVDTDSCKNDCTFGSCEYKLLLTSWGDDPWLLGIQINDTTTTINILATSWEAATENLNKEYLFDVTHGHTIAITYIKDKSSYRSRVYDSKGTLLDDHRPVEDYSFTATCD